MKKYKFIGIGVAALGMVLSIGGAVALYQKAASPATMGIGAGAHAGASSVADYTINGNTGDSAATPFYANAAGNNLVSGGGLSADYPQIKYEFALGADFDNNVAEQTYVMGKVSVSLTNLDSDYYNKVQVYASVTGYGDGTIGASSFGTPIINNVLIESGETNCSGSKVVSVASSGATHKLVVWVKFVVNEVNQLATANMLTINEKTDLFDLDVSWQDLDANYDACAYIIGTGNMWTPSDEYRMSIDPTKNAWIYRFDNLVGSPSWTECKGAKTNKKAGDGVEGLTISKYSYDPNFSLTNATTYSLLWNEPQENSQLYTE